MAKPRSLRPWWWNEFRDDGMRAGMPFTFMQVEHLTALGIVREADDIPMLDGDLLANGHLRPTRLPDTCSSRLPPSCGRA
jgi:hypothetical protein